MKLIKISLLIVMIKPVLGVWLSYEEAVLNSPFEVASLGWTISVPNEDAYVYRGKGDNWKSWYKVSLPSMDTTLFLDRRPSSCFILDNNTGSISERRAPRIHISKGKVKPIFFLR